MPAPRFSNREVLTSAKINLVAEAVDAAAAAVVAEVAERTKAIAAAVGPLSGGVTPASVAAAVQTEATTRASAVAAEAAARAAAIATVTLKADQALTVATQAATAPLDLSNIREFASEAEAAAGGVLPGRLYRTGTVLHVLAATAVEGGGGSSVIPARSISISPTDLNGVALGDKTFTVTTTGSITSISWVVLKPDSTWAGSSRTQATSGTTTITPYLFQAGQRVEAWDTDDYSNMRAVTGNIYPTVTSSGGQTTAPLPTGSGGGSAGAFPFILQGQSNAVFLADSYSKAFKSLWLMMDAFRIYTGLTQAETPERWARSDQAADFSLASGSNTFHFDQAGDPRWLNPMAAGANINVPSTWANTDIMNAFLRYTATRKNDAPLSRPLGLIRVHTEYDSRLGAQGRATYDAGTREFFARYREATGRPVSLSPIFLLDPAYDSGTSDATMTVIRDVHRSQAMDTSLGVFLIGGSSLDATDRGDGSHWDDDGADRAARRGAVALARWFHDNSYARNDLSSFPRLGPTVNAIETVSGNTSALDALWALEGGADDLTMPTAPNYESHKVLDNGVRRNVTSLTRISGTRTRFGLAAPLTSSNVTYSFGDRTPFNGPNSQVTDNWHTKPKPAFTNGSTIADVRMIQNRFGGVITLGSPPVSTGTPTATSAGPPQTWVKAFEDTFSEVPALGNNALNAGKWKRTNFGTGPAHGGGGDGIGINWDGGAGLESTGNSIKIRTRRVNNSYQCSGFMQGSSTDPTSWAYHPGYAECYVKFRSRLSHANARGIGSYMLMWPAPDTWSSEIDILETPGAVKNRAMATMHADMTGAYNLNANNNQSHVEAAIDLSQWHIWELYRTYRMVNGVLAATVRVKIDGKDRGAPAFWTDNRYLCERMVFGAAGFCGQTPYNQGWYTAPDATTPTDFWCEMDYVEIWTPPQGQTGGVIPTDVP